MSDSGKPTKADQPTFVRYGVLGMLALAAMSAYLTRQCLAAANTTIQRELELDNAAMGRVFGAFALGYMLFQVPGGWLGDRVGTRPTLSLCSALWSLVTIWTAWSWSFTSLLLSRLSYGLAQAGMVPVSARILKDWLPVSRHGIAGAILTMSQSVGSVTAIAVTAVMMDHFHWRVVFQLYSLVGLCWSAVFYVWFRTRPREHSWVNEAEQRLIEGPVSPQPPAGVAFDPRSLDSLPPVPMLSDKSSALVPSAAKADTRKADPVRRDVLRQGDALQVLFEGVASLNLWAICIQSFFRAAGYNFFVTFFPAFLEFAYLISRTSAGRYAALPLAGVILGSLSGGLLIDAILAGSGSKWLSRSGVAAAALGLTGVLVAVSARLNSPLATVGAISLGAYFSGMAGPATWAATIDMGGRRTATIVGLMNMAGSLAGVVVTPLLGKLMDWIKAGNGSWDQVIFLHAAFYSVAGITWLLVRSSRLVIAERDT